MPQRLVAARSVYLLNDSGDSKAFDRFYQELTKWGRFNVVGAASQAETVMVLTTNSSYAATVVSGASLSGGGFVATAVTVPSDKLCLKVFASSNAALLWTDSTDKWVTSGRAPSKLVSNLRKRMPNP